MLRDIMQQLEAGDVEGALRSMQIQRGRTLGDQVRAAIEDEADGTEQSVCEEAVVAGDPAADFPAVLTKDVPGG